MNSLGPLMNNPEVQQMIKDDPNLLSKMLQLVTKMQQGDMSALADPDPQVQKLLKAMVGGAMGGGMGDLFGGGPGPAASTPQSTEPTQAKPRVEEVKGPKEKTKREKANDLYRQKQFDDALRMYNELKEETPNDISIWNNIAAVYIEKGEYETALQILDEALEKRYEVKAPYEVVAKLMARRGSVFAKQNKIEQAIEAYEAAKIEDNTRQIRVALSDLKKLHKKNQEEAYYDADKAEEARNLGNEAFRNQDFPQAKSHYDEAIKRNPKDPRTWQNRATCFQKLMSLTSALSDVEKALELDPKFVKAYGRKAQILGMMKEFNKALNCYHEGLALDPENVELQNGLNALNMKIQKESMNTEQDQEQVARAMADPEIQKILGDPQFTMLLRNAETDPSVLISAMNNDPKIKSGVEKLIAAGVLKTA